MSVTNFHGILPKEILCIPKSLCTLKDTSLPHLLKNLSWNQNFCRNLCLPSFLAQAQQTHRKLRTPGYDDGSDNVTLQMLGHKATHLGP